MKYTNTEVEEFIDKILFSVRYAKEGHDDYESALNDIEETCKNFKYELYNIFCKKSVRNVF